MIKFSAFADEVTTSIDGQVDFLVANGIRHIEMRSLNNKNILDLSPSELGEMKKKLDDNGISVSAIGSPIGKIKLDQPFEAHLDKFRHAIHLARFFNAPYIRVFSYYAADGKHIDDFRDEVIRRMSVKASLLEGSGITMVHENEADIYGCSAAHCADIVQSVASPNLKLVYDPGNFVWSEHIVNNMQVCWPVVAPFVVHVHIKDWKLGSVNVGCIPGEGDGQVKELLATLSAINYTGYITLEPHLTLGGQFGGQSGPELFGKAISATRKLCDAVGLEYC
jgi:sugar phosphate isomerase/epimerase